MMNEKGGDASLLIVIMTMLGYQKAEKTRVEAVKRLMKLRHFNGMIGGVPKKALYFIGTTQEGRLIYLDPHIVQKASTS